MFYTEGGTLCVRLREEYGLRALESGVLSGAVWLKREEVTGEWRKVNNKELQDLY